MTWHRFGSDPHPREICYITDGYLYPDALLGHMVMVLVFRVRVRCGKEDAATFP